MNKNNQIKAWIISGGSGVGKGTLVDSLQKEISVPTEVSISATTRPLTAEEIQQRRYIRFSNDQFQHAVDQDLFLEWTHNDTGHYYGTLKSEVERINKEGKVAIFDVNGDGARAIKKILGKEAIIFYLVALRKTRRERIIERGRPVSSEELKKRLDEANTQDLKMLFLFWKRIWIRTDKLTKEQVLAKVLANIRRYVR